MTVVIVARNEENNIGSCIESIIRQTYPENLFELILVDDHSVDSTAAIARSFEKKNISVINLQDKTMELANQTLNEALAGVTNGQIEIAKEVLQKVYDNLAAPVFAEEEK